MSVRAHSRPPQYHHGLDPYLRRESGAESRNTGKLLSNGRAGRTGNVAGHEVFQGGRISTSQLVVNGVYCPWATDIDS